ncbi:MAG: DUF4127 family protein [Chloroflexota bacterium]
MKIALIPLDERPVNTRYPRMIADIAGIDFVMPPLDLLSKRRDPNPYDALLTWLEDTAPQLDVLIVSIEQFVFGGLIASRITNAPTTQLMTRLDRLIAISEQYPAMYMFAFSVITRISNANNNIEEPLYWDTQGINLYRYSQLMHKQQIGQDVQALLDTVKAKIPSEHIHDFTFRRLRNHQMNLQLLEQFGHDRFDLLVISSDDTSEYGYGSQEKAWLQTWVQRLYADDDRLLMYPGADEIGCVLLMRAVLDGASPQFYIHYAIDEDKERVAPYEDGAIRITVERQIKALGGIIADNINTADFIVAVNPPSRIGQEYDPEAQFFAEEHQRRQPYIEQFVQDIHGWLASEKRVIICDVAYPNGSDPMLIEQLLTQTKLHQLASYGAWNTAGNTIGVALAQGIASARAVTDEQHIAQQTFLLHRFLEDWGYQHLVREEVRDWLEAQTGRRDPLPNEIDMLKHEIQQRLDNLLTQLSPLSDDYTISRIHLPWQRTFEVDFDLERTS